MNIGKGRGMTKKRDSAWLKKMRLEYEAAARSPEPPVCCQNTNIVVEPSGKIGACPRCAEMDEYIATLPPFKPF